MRFVKNAAIFQDADVTVLLKHLIIDVINFFCRANGMMRTMDTKDLLNTLPVIQTQFDALLKFDVRAL